MAHLVPPSVLAHLSAATRAHLLGRTFFPGLIASPFMSGLRAAFYVSAAMSLIAAVASLFRGQQYIHGMAPQESQASSQRSRAGADAS